MRHLSPFDGDFLASRSRHLRHDVVCNLSAVQNLASNVGLEPVIPAELPRGRVRVELPINYPRKSGFRSAQSVS